MEQAQGEGKYGYTKRPFWQWIALYAVVAVVGYGLLYYFVLAKTPEIQPPQALQLKNSSPVPLVQKISVEGDEFVFNPSTITVKKGQEVELNFKNTGQYPHDFVVPELNLKTKNLNQGEEETLFFTPEKAGTFNTLCDLPSHAEKGMVGTLVVE